MIRSKYEINGKYQIQRFNIIKINSIIRLFYRSQAGILKRVLRELFFLVSYLLFHQL